MLCHWPSHCSPYVWIEGHRSLFPVLRTYGGMRSGCVTHSVNIRRQMSWHAGNAFEFPHSIDALPYEVRTQLAQKKMDSFRNFCRAAAVGATSMLVQGPHRRPERSSRRVLRAAVAADPPSTGERDSLVHQCDSPENGAASGVTCSSSSKYSTNA